MSERNWIRDLPQWEQDLFKEAADAAVYERRNTGPTHRPGEWMPYGRAPYELIPEPDMGPAGWTTGMHNLYGWPEGSEQLRRWHALRRAGLG